MARRTELIRRCVRLDGDWHAPDDPPHDKRPGSLAPPSPGRHSTARGTDAADTVAASFGTGTNLRRAERRPVGPDRCFIAGGVVVVVIVVVSGVMYR